MRKRVYAKRKKLITKDTLMSALVFILVLCGAIVGALALLRVSGF
jgi:hypothetical protein